MPARRADNSILVFRLGALGDTLVAVPALWAIRHHFADAHLSLLCDFQVGKKKYVLASDLLRNSGIVDNFVLYPVHSGVLGRLLRPFRMFALALRLRGRGYHTVVYLPPTGRARAQVKRDRLFFRLAGIRRMIGMDVPMELPSRRATRPLPTLPREMDLLISRLNAAGIPAAPPTRETVSIGLGAEEAGQVDQWLKGLPPDGGRPWIAVGPGSKMPAKRWPAERYRQVVQQLIERYDVWPVIFGGGEDRTIGEELLQRWGRGYNAAGALPLRASASAIGRSRLYLGNDTGTMHLAAAAGVRCVSVFCSRNFPGLWDPYGAENVIFRTAIECEGCMLDACIERGMECIMRITEQQVVEACARALQPAMPPDGQRGKSAGSFPPSIPVSSRPAGE